MTLNKLIEELTFYSEFMGMGDAKVTLFTSLDDNFCAAYDEVDAVTSNDDVIHIWPKQKV